MNIYTSHQKLFKNGFLFGALLLGLAFSFKEATPAKAVTANFNGPVYRLYNPNSGEHVYTMGLTEKNNLVHLGWGYEGVLADSYYNYPGVNYTKIPVYRLYNSQSGQHLYTKNTYEVSSLRTKGWSNEGIVFYDSSNCPMASTTPVYRLYNPNSGQHFFTNDFNESNYLMNLGWNYEGEAFKFNYPYQWEGKNNSTLISEERIKINIINNKEVFVMNTYRTHKKLFKNGLLFGALLLGIGLSFKEATPAKAVTANFNGPVYRLYNPNSGEHVYTMELTEKNNLVSLGWGYEGILGTSYYTMNGQSYDKIPVYRLYSKNSGEHLYTINTNEVNQLKNYGWVNEGIVFYDASHYGYPHGEIINRLYNPNSGQHFYTKSIEETAFLTKIGWNDEGVAFCFSSPVPTQSGPLSPA